MLDTDQLRSFLAIVDSGSFTRAADRVGRTQSAVSMQMRRLEEKLGRPLFAKQGRGVRLSEDGERLVDYARQMLTLEASALAAVAGQGLTGRVRLGMPDDYAEAVLPRIMRPFARQHPLVDVSVACDNSAVLAERVQARDLDFAVVTGLERMAGFELLCEQRLYWVTSQDSRVAEVRPVPLALDIAVCSWRQAALAALERAEVPHRLLMSARSFAAIAPIVLAGLAVTVLPEIAMRPGMRAAPRESGLPPLPATRIGLIETPARPSREAQALMDVARAALSSNGAPGLAA